jgi:hypothetical protein
VLQHVKPLRGGDLQLQVFKAIVLKFKNALAFCANHMVVMLTEMTVLITDHAVVEPVFAGKAKSAHQFQRIADKIGGKTVSVSLENFDQFICSQMLFGLKEDFQYMKPVLEPINVFLLKQLLKLLFLLTVYLLHDESVVLLNPCGCGVFSGSGRAAQLCCSCRPNMCATRF